MVSSKCGSDEFTFEVVKQITERGYVFLDLATQRTAGKHSVQCGRFGSIPSSVKTVNDQHVEIYRLVRMI
ncbi:hypothetical protein CAter282_2414 [Collimonas arenae]|uniref:Uncharacterized protein n=1 Tax=Collimonas arenae TaxID=279058 RepID=A0A127PRA0_9BURK|nr:hypothetical protein CAter10_2659 [Collimonas arenae]AMP10161.1 hypothetical protein CAter282_2414 [Collimonas arenae]